MKWTELIQVIVQCLVL